MEAAESAVPNVLLVLTGAVYWLKPVPVKVIGCAGAPGRTAAEADKLDAVTVGATSEASPMPIAPTAVYVAPPSETLLTVRSQRVMPAVTAPAVSVTVSVIEVAPPTVSVVARVIPAETQAEERASVAFEEKPLPVTVIGVVAATKGTADGLTSLISLPVIVKTEPEVTEPPSGFVTVTVYAPTVAGPPVTEFVGSTPTVRLVEVPVVDVPWHDAEPAPQVDFAI
jgi:hypothetical protein